MSTAPRLPPASASCRMRTAISSGKQAASPWAREPSGAWPVGCAVCSGSSSKGATLMTDLHNTSHPDASSTAHRLRLRLDEEGGPTARLKVIGVGGGGGNAVNGM